MGATIATAEMVAQPRTVEVTVTPGMTQSALLDAAESSVRQAIAQGFAQQSDLAAIAVLVLGNRNGEIVPILLTTVSREQWQAQPQVSAWTQYYTEATHALLQRPQRPPSTAPDVTRNPVVPVIQGIPVSVTSPGPVPLIRPPAVARRPQPIVTPRPQQPLSVDQVNQTNVSEWD